MAADQIKRACQNYWGGGAFPSAPPHATALNLVPWQGPDFFFLKNFLRGFLSLSRRKISKKSLWDKGNTLVAQVVGKMKNVML